MHHKRISQGRVIVGAAVMFVVLSSCGAEPEGQGVDVSASAPAQVTVSSLNECEKPPGEYGAGYEDGRYTVDGIVSHYDGLHPYEQFIRRHEGDPSSRVTGVFGEASELDQEILQPGAVWAELTDLEVLSGPLAAEAARDSIHIVVRKTYLERARSVLDAGGSVILTVYPMDPADSWMTSLYYNHADFDLPEVFRSRGPFVDQFAVAGLPMVAILPDGAVTPIGGGCLNSTNADYLESWYRESAYAASNGLSQADYVMALLADDDAATQDAKTLGQRPDGATDEKYTWTDQDPHRRPLDGAPPEIVETFGRGWVNVTLVDTKSSLLPATGNGWVCTYTVMGRGTCYAVGSGPEDTNIVVGMEVYYDVNEGITVELYDTNDPGHPDRTPIAHVSITPEAMRPGPAEVVATVGQAGTEMRIDSAAG